MPSTSAAQQRFMKACAEGWMPKKGGTKCPPRKVSKEFAMADALKKRSRNA